MTIMRSLYEVRLSVMPEKGENGVNGRPLRTYKAIHNKHSRAIARSLPSRMGFRLGIAHWNPY